MKFAGTPAKGGFSLSLVFASLVAPLFAQTPDSFNPSPNDVVYSLAVQPDGKVLLGGYFSGFIGGPIHGAFARINSDGSLDTAFTPAADALVNAIALQPDGAIVVAGGFGTLGGQPRSRLARVSADGVVDPVFNPGADSVAESLAVQPDGKILVGGLFGQLAGQSRSMLGRLNTDGSLDASFNPGANAMVASLVVQPDGKILVGGWFTSLAGTNRAYLGRLNANGSIDAAFNPGASNFVSCLALQADGKIVVGGWFTNLAGQARNYIGRLNADGSLDNGFNPGANDLVYSLAVQTDSAILAGGYFTNLAGAARNYVGRMNTNGVIDATFNPGAGGQVAALAVQADGKVLVGGWFNSLGGTNRSGVGRLNNTAASTQNLSYASSKITWLRGGTGPEVGRVTFDYSTNGGKTWTNLAAPSRIAGGWQLTSISIPSTASIRARGFVAGGQYDASGWFVETNIGPLAIVQQPASRTNLAATPASLSVRVGGGATPAYQWRKNGINLTNTVNISGATAPSLSFSNVFGGDSGSYTVVINDGLTTLTSQVATLTVLDPYITTQPVSLTNNALTTATFNFAAIGAAPLSYLWFKNGTALADTGNVSGSHSNILTLTGVLGADAGAYFCFVTNVSGSATSSVATLTVVDPFIVGQTTNQAATAGSSTFFTISVLASSPLSFQWLHNGVTVPGVNNPTLNLSSLTAADAGFYQAILSNAYGMATSGVMTLTVNYLTADAFSPGLLGQVNISSLALQPDGKLLIGGAFGAGGCPYPCVPSDIGRFNPDGSIDFSFYQSANNTVSAIAIQTNGAIVIGGAFTYHAGDSPIIPPYLARFTANGQVDSNFAPSPDNAVTCLALQPDGALLVGGNFANLAGQPRSHLARLLPSGVLDTNFNPGADAFVTSLAVQPDGKILVGGWFQNLAGMPCHLLGRLNPNGSLDTAFAPNPDTAPNVIAVQPDGKILVGGSFTTLAGHGCNNLGRLNPNGSLDLTFTPNIGSVVYSLAVQTDGRVLVGGNLQPQASCYPISPLARLNPDGSLDLSFNPCGGISSVGALALQKDGEIVVGGSLTALLGQPRAGVGRLINTYPAPAAESLSFDSSSVTWLRSGTGPEVWRVTFELSTDGANWTLLGDAAHIANGWQLTGLVIPTNSIVRARGFAVGAGWYVETVAGLPVLTSQPLNQTNNATATATFAITAYGGTPLSYQWLKNGVALNNSGNVSGAQTPTLTLTNVLGSDAGAYSIVLSNVTGSITSSVANLTVIDPWISAQPAGQAKNAGQSAVLTVSALGTAPLSFQWLQNGTNLSEGGTVFGSQTATLTLTNLAGANAGTYLVIVTNVWGSVTSSPAPLSVVDPLIYTNPVSQSVHGGQTITLSVSAAGAQPLGYQWRKSGSPVSNATNSSLVFTSIQGFDAGSYDVIVADSFGTVTSTVATLTVADPFISANPTNQSIQGGQTVYLTVSAVGGSPLSYQWRTNGLPVPGATNASLIFTNAQGANAGNYDVIVSDAFGSRTSSVAIVKVNLLQLDSFNPGAGTVSALAIQPDGKILVGAGPGAGKPGLLARLNPDGSPDGTFNAAVSAIEVSCLALQPDGKIIVGGEALVPQRYIFLWRLNGDGSIDAGFTNNPASGPNNFVYSLALQPDGKILVAGNFTSLGGQSHPYVGRLNGDGTVDTNFTGAAGSTAYSVAVQPDGAILVGGGFSTLNTKAHGSIGRLHADGTLDTNFNASASGLVWSVVIQPDNKILVGGNFGTLNGIAHRGIGRFNSDGTLDTNFTAAASSEVHAIGLQNDGKVLQSDTALTRRNPDGSLDLTFNATYQGTIYALALQSDGAILAGGSFSSLNGIARTNIARFINTDPAIQNLSSDNTSVTWLRSGTGPEVWRTTFESSTNGLNWTALGGGQRIAGGWQLTNLNLVGIRNLRARGYSTGAEYNGSDWFAESISGPPVFDVLPSSRTNLVNTTATFYAMGSGNTPLTYQWLKGGGRLTNGGNVFGATTPLLTLSNVFGGNDAGAYSVVISNASGVLTSSIANLTVIEPLITKQPTNQFASTGQSVSFIVNALGTAPLSYQWRKNGTNLSGPNASVLVLTNVTRAANAANYSVVVSSSYGSVTSQVASLLVDPALPDYFNPGAGSSVKAFAIQTDGKILVGGDFTNLSGVARSYLGRLNPDGSLDTNFNPVANYTVSCFAVQPDGKILIGGWFGGLGGQPRNFLGRLNPDGSLDAPFNPGANNAVESLALQPDGKILVAGAFTTLAGRPQNYLGRLNPDGSADTNFLGSATAWVHTILLQPDGRILASGEFAALDSQTTHFIGRLAADGSFDPTFRSGADNYVFSILLQPDGKVIAAGNFTTLGSGPRQFVGRLNSDGSPDTSFNPPVSGTTDALALQADGKVLIAGPVSPLAGQTQPFIARLNPDGSLDTTFAPTPNSVVLAIAVQSDGSTLVGGSFGSISGQNRSCLARLTPTDPATQYLSSDGQSITWLRGGTSPEISATTFETSTDGTNWISAGSGYRTAGGWRLSGLALARGTSIRARGYTFGGYYTGSGWFVQSIASVLAPAPVIVNDTTLSFSSNLFSFNTRAVPGQVVVIEASTDFKTWIPIQTNLVTVPASAGVLSPNTSLFGFTDPQAVLFPHRFYRARLYSGTLPSPSLGTSVGLSSGGFAFNLAAVRGQSLIIEASTNLANWVPISTNSFAAGSLYFSDPAATFPQRFYRARVQ